MYSDEKSVRELLQKVLSYSHAEQTEVVYLGTESALTRFANNFIHQNVAERNYELRVRAITGKRMGVATTNRLDDQSSGELGISPHSRRILPYDWPRTV